MPDSMFTTVAVIGIDTPVLACQDCGNLVWFEFRDTHVRFHAYLAEVVADSAGA